MPLVERTEAWPSRGGADTHTADRAGSVLVVDDEPNVRLVFRTALESAGFRVEVAADGPAALKLLTKAGIDVVLLDLLMPGMGGMEVLRRLREEGNDVPVVIVTAHGSIPDAVEAMKLGAIDFLSKPLNPERLRRVVGEVIRRHAESETRPRSELEPAQALRAEPGQRTSSTVVTIAPATL